MPRHALKLLFGGAGRSDDGVEAGSRIGDVGRERREDGSDGVAATRIVLGTHVDRQHRYEGLGRQHVEWNA